MKYEPAELNRYELYAIRLTRVWAHWEILQLKPEMERTERERHAAEALEVVRTEATRVSRFANAPDVVGIQGLLETEQALLDPAGIDGAKAGSARRYLEAAIRGAREKLKKKLSPNSRKSNLELIAKCEEAQRRLGIM